MAAPKRIVVIGGGLIGLASALRLSERFPDSTLFVLEKEDSVGRHQSGNNSGVLHAGLYYKPGSSKARLAVRGIHQMTEFCQRHGISHEICGKLVVATSEQELPRLHALFERGRQNGLRDLALIGPQRMREIEPHVAGIAAIHVPEEGIVDYARVCTVLASLIPGGVFTGTEATNIRKAGREWIIETNAGDFTCDCLVNCAGLHSDRIAAMAGVRLKHRIVPFRGEYYRIKPDRTHLVRNLIYPVPDPAFPFLGVHFTRLIHGGIEAGPNAVLAFAREGYTAWKVNPMDLIDSVSFVGLWRFAAKYRTTCLQEMRQSFSRRLFCRSLQRLVPEIASSDLERGGAGVRAQALDDTGCLVQDFVFLKQSGAVHLLNAPSPGATASLAIGEEVADHATSAMDL